ncbi:hypothetical protein GF373_16930, partial [bacterium]|nr:hypothetical protein [bacterium]
HYTGPSISHRGDKLLFASGMTGARDIFVLDFNTGDVTPIIEHESDDYSPVWSMDDRSVFFVSEREGNPEIYMADIDVSQKGDEILHYFGNEIDNQAPVVERTGSAGNLLGVHMTTQREKVDRIGFYIDADPAPFTWQIRSFVDGKPSDPLYEGTASPQETGWFSLDVGPYEIPQDYLLNILFQEDNKPILGMAAEGADYRTWTFDPSQAGEEVLQYFDDRQELSAPKILRTGPAGSGLGMQMTSSSGQISRIEFFIDADPAPFTWQILPFTDGEPVNEPLYEGTAEPQETGWFSIDVGSSDVPEDYLVAIIFQEDDKPVLGLATGGEDYRGWYAFSGGWSNPQQRPLMIRAVVPSGTGGQWQNSKEQPLMIRAIASSEYAGPIRLTESPGFDGDPAPAPDGDRLAFASDRGGNLDLWLMNVDGSQLEPLTNTQALERQPAWSPDGSQLVFRSETNGNQDIYLIQDDGSELMQLIQDEAIDTDPVWAMDGDRVLYASMRDDSFEIFSLNLINPKPQRLAVGAGNLRHPEVGAFDEAEIKTYRLNDYHAKQQVTPQSVSVSQAQSLRVNMVDIEAKPGDRIEMPLVLASDTGIAYVLAEVNYESTVLRLISHGMEEDSQVKTIHAIHPEILPSKRGWARVGWTGIETPPNGQLIVPLTFEILKGTLRPTTEVVPALVQAFDANQNLMAGIIDPGKIRILGNPVSVPDWMLY